MDDRPVLHAQMPAEDWLQGVVEVQIAMAAMMIAALDQGDVAKLDVSMRYIDNLAADTKSEAARAIFDGINANLLMVRPD
jgi:hypothetical protein